MQVGLGPRGLGALRLSRQQDVSVGAPGQHRSRGVCAAQGAAAYGAEKSTGFLA